MKKFFIFLFLVSCSQNQVITEFSKSDFSLEVSCSKSEDNDDLCFFYEDKIQEAIDLHNAFLGNEVFEMGDIYGERSLIDITFSSYILDENGERDYGIAAQTTVRKDQIDIVLNRQFARYVEIDEYMPCTIMHELGHALGYRGHNEEDGTLMSESADCETEGWYDDFYDWFQENYGE